MAKQKWYVVFNGMPSGICETWDECRLRTEGYPGASYKAYSSLEEAVIAYREGTEEDARAVLRAIAAAPVSRKNQRERPPEVLAGSIAVDAACSGNPGVMEYRGVDIDSGREIFHKGPFPEGTNNIGEFLAIVHALALLYNNGSNAAIYSDSVSGMAWVRRRKANTTLKRTEASAPLLDLVARAETWLHTHQWRNAIYKWQTERWGEIPADFGRK